MTQIQNLKPVHDLEERTFQFYKTVRLFVKTLPKTAGNLAISPKVSLFDDCILDLEI